MESKESLEIKASNYLSSWIFELSDRAAEIIHPKIFRSATGW
jgi:hypothetical protein